MSGRRGGLGDAKGGDLLAALAARMARPKPSAPVAMTPPPPASPSDLAAAMARRERAVPIPKPQGRAAKQMEKAKRKKEIIRLPRAAVEAALAPFRAEPEAVIAPPPAQPHDFGEAAFRRLANMRDRLDAFVATHHAPPAVSDATAAQVAQLVLAGAEGIAPRLDPEDGYFLGHDFGTSATKAVLRNPYRRGSAFAVPVPADLASAGQAHLWPSTVFIDGDARFHLCPGAGRTMLAGFKSALIERRGNRMAGHGVTSAEAAAAFLALHLAVTFGTLFARDPAARVAGVNLAVPVVAMADAALSSDVARVVRAALRLVPDAARLTLDHVRIALALDESGDIPFELHTELSGAIAGYCAQPRRFVGAHMIVDCGSATLDMASFQLGGNQWPIGIHAAAVERLGADACALYRRLGERLADCQGAARFQEHRVFGQTLDSDRVGFTQNEERRFPYQLILIGGGIAGEVHGPWLERMQAAFDRPFHRPALAIDLACDPATDPTRLTIADGLARDPIELREVRMPRDRPRRVIAVAPEAITKDQV